MAHGGRIALTVLILLFLVAASVNIGVYQSKIAWYLGKSKGGVAGDDVCCPGGAAYGRLCEEPRQTMHNTLNKYFSFWAWQAQIFQLVFAVMAFCVIAWYIQPHREVRVPAEKAVSSSKSFHAFVGVTIIVLVLAGFGTQFNMAYSQIENDQWSTFWGQPATTITGDAPQYTIAQNGTADCYNNVGSKGPNFVGFSWVIISLWFIETIVFIIGVFYIRRVRPSSGELADSAAQSHFGIHSGDVHDLSFSARSRSAARNGDLNM